MIIQFSFATLIARIDKFDSYVSKLTRAGSSLQGVCTW